MNLTFVLLLFFISGLLIQDVRSQSKVSFCDRKFTDKTGTIEFPSTKQRNDSNTLPQECSFIIAQPEDKIINLKVDYLKSQVFSEDCTNNRLEIRDGNTTNSTLLKKLCGFNTTGFFEPIASSQNYLFIALITNGKLSNLSFRINYSATGEECGPIERTSPGTINIPGPRKNWVFDSNCIWIIRAPPGYAVQLTWPVFNLNNPGNVDYCRNDYVNVYEGSRITEKGFTRRYCFLFKPPPVQQSQGREMTINFRSSKFMSRQTFQAKYTFVDVSKSCQGVYYATEGTLTSPNYPMKYPNNAECVWIIKAPLKRLITLKIQSFQLENKENCVKDYLEVRSGGYEDATILGKFCGNEIPESITSFTNQMYIKFVSDSASNDKGFEITWNTRKQGCGGDVQRSSGIILSPNYPDPYLPSINQRTLFCNWFIRAPAGSTLKFTFLDLDIENKYSCAYDYVSIAEIFEGRTIVPVRYCGKNNLRTVKTTSNQARVTLHGLAQTRSRGFRLKYETVCNNKVSGFRGVIESPNFPDVYQNNLNCSWLIEVPPGNKIDLVFSFFDLEPGSKHKCDNDYLLIQEGDNGKAQAKLEKLCGHKEHLLPLSISSTKHQVFLNFRTNHKNSLGGFRLDWRLNGCGAHLTKNSGQFILPSYYSLGNNKSFVCEWLIEVNSQKIEISFQDTDTSVNRTFSPGGQIEIYNGRKVSNSPIGRVYSSTSPVIFTSTHNALFVRFTSDKSYVGHGFVANYKNVATICGGRFISDSGTFFSTNYPKKYLHNEQCKWFMTVEESHVIDLNFAALETADEEPCTKDFVVIYDGHSTQDVVLGTRCGKVSKPPSYTSTGNKMMVVFKTDWKVSAKGFMATFNKKCGRRIVIENEGQLRFLSNLRENNTTPCTWTFVTQDPGDRVALTFTYIDFLSPESNCSRNGIKVYDGEGIDKPLIAKWCTNEIPPTFTSTGNALTVYTMGNKVGDRFDAVYSILNTACGATLNSESGIIATPSYPCGFVNVKECIWTINVTSGNSVVLNFTDFYIPFTENCDTDYMEIRENDGIGKVLGVFCGYDANSIISSKSLWLKFKSIGNTFEIARGFVASYRYLNKNRLKGNNGVIASPVYPMPYRQKNEYSWRIDVDKNSTIAIILQNVHMNNLRDSNCTSLLIIYDGKNEQSPILQKICSIPFSRQVRSSGNVIFIKMITVDDYIGHWFRLRWWKIEGHPTFSIDDKSIDECGGSRRGSSGIIKLNKLPISITLPPKDSHTCEWIVIVDLGKKIKSRILEYKLTNSDRKRSVDDFCKHNNVTIKCGLFDEYLHAENINICENQMPPLQNTSGNQLNVKLALSKRDTHFKMLYEEIGGECSGQFVLNWKNSEQVINSTEFPNSSPLKKQCVWVIFAPTGQRLSADLGSFFNFSSRKCDDEYIEIKDGSLESSTTLGKFCKTPTWPITSTTNSMLVHYFKNLPKNLKSKNVDNRGLEFKVKLADDCGGTLFGTNGTISSPYYPNSYAFKSYNCVWKIIGPEKRGLSLQFEKLDLPWRRNCKETDHISIEENGINIGTFCGGGGKLNGIDILGNEAQIRFLSTSDPTSRFKGFRLKYSTRPDSCGGKLSGKFGELKSTGYPRPLIYKQCKWTIEVPDGLQARFTINDLDVGNTGQLSFYHDPSMKLLFKQFTKNTKNGLIRSSSNFMVVQYSNSVLGHRGIQGRYQSFDKAPCGGVLNGIQNKLSSPNDPSFYNSSYYCKWTVKLPQVFKKSMSEDGLSVILSVSGFIAQNDVNMSCKSPNGFLKISDEKGGGKMGTICGHFQNESLVVRSVDPVLTIEAIKANALSTLDFNLDYRWFPCGGKLTGNAHTIISPSDLSYPIYCTWEVEKPQDGNAINIEFTRMHLGPCDKSYIIIKSGTAQSPEIGMYCGQNTTSLTINSTNLWIEYYAIEAPGDFMLQLQATNVGCGGITRNASKDIMSPGFPKAYPNNTECTWKLIGPKNHFIELVFIERLHLETSKDCKNDYIKIYEWDNSLNKWMELKTICGRTAPKMPIKSSTNKMKVIFKSDEVIEGDGFRADWSTYPESATDAK